MNYNVFLFLIILVLVFLFLVIILAKFFSLFLILITFTSIVVTSLSLFLLERFLHSSIILPSILILVLITFFFKLLQKVINLFFL